MIRFRPFFLQTRFGSAVRKVLKSPAGQQQILPAATRPEASKQENEEPHQQEKGTNPLDDDIFTNQTFTDEHDYLSSNWSTSFNGIGRCAFPKPAQQILLAPIPDEDIEIKPDGLIYLPEIKYRRILNRAFGPGGWGMVPRGPHTILKNTLTREYALIVNGRFVSQARGEQDFFSEDGLPTATEGVKSNALMRCCKDLGIASELWDPSFIRKWKVKHAVEVWASDIRTKAKKRLWRLKGEKLSYPYQEQ